MLSNALSVLNKIKDNKYEAYIVGGYVRDYLLKSNSSDIDIATNMPIEELIKHYKIDRTNEKYGSYVLHFNKKVSFEVTVFRKELSYNNQRHPIISLVDSYKEDYIRRDFTINALAFDYKMLLHDYCGGKNDLNAKIIKTIREPNETFKEDPVRIIRAIYFKNKLNFDYDINTYQAILNNVDQLNSISISRVFNEFKKICKCNLNHFLFDLIETKAYKFLPFKEVLYYVYKNEIIIEDADDLLTLNFYLRNSIKYLGLSYAQTNHLKKIATAIHNDFSPRALFGLDKEEIDYASHIYSLIFKVDRRRELLYKKDKLPIRYTKEVEFKFRYIHDYIDNKNDIKHIKSLVIDKILNFELNNNKDEIIEFILSQKNKSMI